MTDEPPDRSPSGFDDATESPDSDEHPTDESATVGGEAPETDGDVTAYTTDVRTLDPTVRWLWVGRALVFGAITGGLTTGGALVVAPRFAWAGGAVFALLALLGSVHALLLYRSWEYRLRDDSVYLHRGVITQVQTVVPYVRVQHIDTSRGPIERLVGLSTMVIYTAGSRGADVTVPGLVPKEAADLQTRLKLLAIESEGEDAV